MRRSVLFALFATLVAIPAAANDLATNWKPIAYDQAQCLSRATAAFRTAGLTTALATGREGVAGTNVEYTGAALCPPTQHVVFLAVAGPARPEAQRLLGILMNGM